MCSRARSCRRSSSIPKAPRPHRSGGRLHQEGEVASRLAAMSISSPTTPQNYRGTAGQHPHHRAQSAAGRRPAGAEVQEQPQAASDQGGRGDPGGRGDGEAGRPVRARRQPGHQGARTRAVHDAGHRQQLAAHARVADADLRRRVPDPRADLLRRDLSPSVHQRRPHCLRQCQLRLRAPRHGRARAAGISRPGASTWKRG